MTPPPVAIIIVNWNGREFLGDCLEAVRRLEYPRDRVRAMVVDNGSSDGSVELVRESFPDIEVYQHEVNNYARANNFGVRTTTSPYVAFLNSDARVDPRWLTPLVAALEAEPRAGAAGSRIVFPDGRLNSTGLDFLPDFHFRDRGFGEPDRAQYAFGAVDGLSGCAVLLRREALREVGLLDEDFEMYYEDVDLSFRLRAAGWSLLYVPDSLVHHLYNASIKKSPRRTKDFFGERNRLFLIARHLPDSLPSSLMRSRAIIESGAATFKRTVPMVLKKWIESGAEPKRAETLWQTAFVAKVQMSRFRRWAKAEARTRGEMEDTITETRTVYGTMVAEADRARDAARAAFLDQEQQRRDREKWLRIIMTELKMRRVRPLDESEQKFLAFMQEEDEKRTQMDLARSAASGAPAPASGGEKPPVAPTPRTSTP
jgi:GT2 family glycosyltransferase